MIVRYEAWPGYAASGYEPSDFEVAMVMIRQGQYVEAADLLEGLVERRPDAYEALAALAICRYGLGDVAQARSHVERALAINPRDALSYEVYGDILSSLGSNAEAQTQWMKGLGLNPGSRSLQSKLGQRRR
jgi:Flp pilus assembly protein TadD